MLIFCPGFERAGVGDLLRDPLLPDLEDLDRRGAEGLGLPFRRFVFDLQEKGRQKRGRATSPTMSFRWGFILFIFISVNSNGSPQFLPTAFSSWAWEMTQS